MQSFSGVLPTDVALLNQSQIDLEAVDLVARQQWVDELLDNLGF